jgi:hypothetical protein
VLLFHTAQVITPTVGLRPPDRRQGASMKLK